MGSTAQSTNPDSFTSIFANRKRIFESVFPPSQLASIPTPVATPSSSLLLQSQPSTGGTPSHGYNTRHHPQSSSSPADCGTTAVSLLPSPVALLVKESRAWHIATSYLSFPNRPFPATTREWIEIRPTAGKDVIDAIRYLVYNNEDGKVDGRENLIEWYMCEVRRHFLTWVNPSCEIPKIVDDALEVLGNILEKLTTAQNIYLYQFKAYLLTVQGDNSPKKSPRKRSKRLEALLEDSRCYSNNPRVWPFLRSLNSIISYSLPEPEWSELVYVVFLDLCGATVGLVENDVEEDGSQNDNTIGGGSIDGDSAYDGIPSSMITDTDMDGDHPVTSDEGGIIVPEEMDGIDDFAHFKEQPVGRRMQARKKLLGLWELMGKIGIGGGGKRGERVFAEVINTIITMYIHRSFAKQWTSPSMIGKQLDEWIENVLGKLILDVLFSSSNNNVDSRFDKLSPRESLRVSRESLDKRRKGAMDIDFGGGGTEEEEQKRRKEDLESWKRMAIGRLGRLRVGELFDIIVDWPASTGGVEDLKAYIDTPQTRLHLTTSFAAAISFRILHPAAATSDVLAAYIRLIRAFTALDPRGVLLDRVSRSIRRYLRERDDTIRVIVRGVMFDSLVRAGINDGEELSELAGELSQGIPTLITSSGGGVEDMDYDDMSWVPDPVDAGPEYKRSKGLDIVGSLFSLWESKEVWIKEVQSILSIRLLQDPSYTFDKEVRTVELLKLRFGEGPTQSCDVMLRDMLDSKGADRVIGEMLASHLNMDQGNELPPFQCKILSRLYWPNMKQEEFHVPSPIKHTMNKYQKGFEQLKKKRKLDWLLSVGTVKLELELEDRMVVVPDATPAQASIIYAFRDDGEKYEDNKTDPKSLSLEQLKEILNMSSPTLNSAMSFWVEKEILKETSEGVYTVTESLESSPNSPLHHPNPTSTSTSNIAGVVPELSQIDDEEKQQERTVIEQFVVGMLTNGGTMPTERILMMLGILVPGGFRWSGEELGEFLKCMKEKGRIDVSGNGWKAVAS